MEDLKKEMNEARDSLYAKSAKNKTNHRRGHYEFVSAGISYGGGQQVSKTIYIIL